MHEISFEEFEARCRPGAAREEDASLRYISSPRVRGRRDNHFDLAYATLWPFVFRAIVGRFPWEDK